MHKTWSYWRVVTEAVSVVDFEGHTLHPPLGETPTVDGDCSDYNGNLDVVADIEEEGCFVISGINYQYLLAVTGSAQQRATAELCPDLGWILRLHVREGRKK